MNSTKSKNCKKRFALLLYNIVIIKKIHNNITLQEQPVRKFLRAGCFLFHSLFPLQGFFFEGFVYGK